MLNNNNALETNWLRRITKLTLIVIVLAVVVDYARHRVLKNILQEEISQSSGLVSVDSLTVSVWPLLQSHLVLKNFHVNASQTPIFIKDITIRQGWKDWGVAHIDAKDISSEDRVTIQEAEGQLETKSLKSQIKVDQLQLKNINVMLPLISFSGSKASFNFQYEILTHHLFLNVDAPDMSFPNEATFGLTGEGDIMTNPPVQGKMKVKIKNIDKMLKELVARGFINESQAGLVTAGSEFLSHIGLQDVSLPLKIENGEVFLGPILLFHVGGNHE